MSSNVSKRHAANAPAIWALGVSVVLHVGGAIAANCTFSGVPVRVAWSGFEAAASFELRLRRDELVPPAAEEPPKEEARLDEAKPAPPPDPQPLPPTATAPPRELAAPPASVPEPVAAGPTPATPLPPDQPPATDQPPQASTPPPPLETARTPEPVSERKVEVEAAPAAAPAAASAHVDPSPIAGLNAPPAYPFVAYRRGWTGTVTVLLEIDAQGIVKAAHVEKSSGYSMLDDAALQQLGKWRFAPARLGGAAVPSTFRQQIMFRLVDGRPTTSGL